MCENCSIPELKPSVQGKKKKKQLVFDCSACGCQYIKTSTNKLFDKTIDNIIKNVDNYEFKKGIHCNSLIGKINCLLFLTAFLQL